jgi:kinetochor protein Mis14/NSL1
VENFRASVKADEEALAARREGDGGLTKEAKLEIKRLERQEVVEEGFRGAVEGLGSLKAVMPATVARMDRARVAGEYVVTER